MPTWNTILPDPAAWRASVRVALAEDHARDDVTSALLGPEADRPARASLVAEADLVCAGLPVLAAVFAELGEAVLIETLASEGAWCRPGAVLARIEGRAGGLLAGERILLNYIQRLSGIATATRRAAEAVAGTPARVTHTRKTSPGLRAFELYAVAQGGGVPNRVSLADAVLWKDNHWALVSGASGLADALARVPPGLPVIIEVEDERQLATALAAGVTHLLIDNQPPRIVAEWARRAGPLVTLQVSGGITLANVRAYAEAGAHLVALGALTHSVGAAPVRCDLEPC